jgi:Fe2+ or Zn2+ uptake regulation protein
MAQLPTNDAWLTHLHAKGYRLTAPMRAIVEVIAQSEFVLDPLEMFDLARKIYPQLGLVTVYRTLEKLEELALVQRVHQVGSCRGYVAAAHGHEHFLLCTRCGRVEYFTGDDLSELVRKISERSKFQIKEHWLQLHGLCENCQS